MKSRTTRDFRTLLAALPKRIQRQAKAAYRLFSQDAKHPSLQFKKVVDSPVVYSVRVGLQYRALGLPKDDYVAWFWIGSHAEYDEILKHL